MDFLSEPLIPCYFWPLYNASIFLVRYPLSSVILMCLKFLYLFSFSFCLLYPPFVVSSCLFAYLFQPPSVPFPPVCLSAISFFLHLPLSVPVYFSLPHPRNPFRGGRKEPYSFSTDDHKTTETHIRLHSTRSRGLNEASKTCFETQCFAFFLFFAFKLLFPVFIYFSMIFLCDT